MKNGIISESTIGCYTIERRADGFRVVHTESGMSSGTFQTYREARNDVQTMQYQTALVKMHGKDGAIEILRGDATINQSAI